MWCLANHTFLNYLPFILLIWSAGTPTINYCILQLSHFYLNLGTVEISHKHLVILSQNHWESFIINSKYKTWSAQLLIGRNSSGICMNILYFFSPSRQLFAFGLDFIIAQMSVKPKHLHLIPKVVEPVKEHKQSGNVKHPHYPHHPHCSRKLKLLLKSKPWKTPSENVPKT